MYLNCNRKRNGFTLVELLVTIGIIGIIFAISAVSVYTILNNSKDNSDKIAIDNMKKSAGVYVKEYKNEVSWEEVANKDNEYEACIPIQTLIAKGYLKDEVLDAENVPLSIILTRDEYNNIISEVSEQYDCGTYAKIVKIPTSNDICNNYTYDGSNHFLIKQNIQMSNYKEINYVDTTYKNTSNRFEHPKNAGEYKALINLADGYQWSDNTTAPKTVTCKINKKTPTLELSSNGNSDTKENIGTKEITLTSEVSGNISIKSSNKNYVLAEVEGEKKIIANGEKKIRITTLAQRNSATSVTITVIPTGEYANNYKNATITYTVGNIKTVTVNKPTSDICYDLSYNASSQKLAKTNEAYKLINNSGIEIGTYTVTARLNYGYIWQDKTTENVEFNCQIKIPKPLITYKNATCNPQNFNVTYNKMYGEGQNLCIPTKIGYTFDGWYSDSKLTQEITNNTVVTNFNAHNLYAKWIAKKYIISFNANGGTVTPTSKEVTYDQVYDTLPAATRTGYTFDGWYTGSSGGTKVTKDDKVAITTNTTLYAHWVAKKYTISFNPNGGTVTPTSKEVTYDQIYDTLPVATRTGYTFNGWYTGSSGGTKVTNDSVVSITKDQTLYAQWLPRTDTKYVVKHYKMNLDGATYTLVDTDTLTGTTDSTVTPNTKNYSGFTAPAKQTVTILADGSRVVNYYYTRNNYTITFNANGGTVTPSSMKIKYEAKYGTLPNAYRTGYELLGWYTAASGGTKIETSTTFTITSNQVLYAQWKANTNTKYVVKHYKMNLDCVNYTLADTETLTGTTDASVTPNTKTYTGFTAPARQTVTILADGSRIVNYYYTRNSYTVKFNANGGTVSPTSKSVVYEAKYGTLPNAFKTGYQHTGWYTATSGGTKVTSDSIVSITGEQTLYAQWSPSTNTKYVVKHYKMNLDGVNYTLANTDTLAGTTGASITPDTKSYTGFTAPARQTVTILADGSRVVNYYYTRNNYTITFNANGGTVTPSSMKIKYEAKYGTLPNAYRTGYELLGWYTATSGGTKIETSTTFTITSNQVLYAQWKATTYTATASTSTYAATASCTNGRTLSNGNCIYETTCEEDCLGWRCDTGCGMCYQCGNEVCGCEDDGGKWIEYETTCEFACTETQNQYRVYTCPRGGTLSGTTCTIVTYSCPRGGTLEGTTCVFK